MKTSYVELPDVSIWSLSARLSSRVARSGNDGHEYPLAMRYLSEEWIAAADAALRQAAASAPAARIVVDQVIEGAASYRVIIEQNAASITLLDAAADHGAADAVFRQQAATAAAVAKGTTDAHQAFLLGHIRFEGAIDVLIERREAFEWLETALAPVLAETVFSD